MWLRDRSTQPNGPKETGGAAPRGSGGKTPTLLAQAKQTVRVRLRPAPAEDSRVEFQDYHWLTGSPTPIPSPENRDAVAGVALQLSQAISGSVARHHLPLASRAPFPLPHAQALRPHSRPTRAPLPDTRHCAQRTPGGRRVPGAAEFAGSTAGGRDQARPPAALRARVRGRPRARHPLAHKPRAPSPPRLRGSESGAAAVRAYSLDEEAGALLREALLPAARQVCGKARKVGQTPVAVAPPHRHPLPPPAGPAPT